MSFIRLFSSCLIKVGKGRKNSMKANILLTAAIIGATAVANVAQADIAELPNEIRESLYNSDMLDPKQPIGDSAYRDWVAKNPPPWTIGYASSYAGNTWRAGVMDRLQNELIPKWKELGMIDEVIITQSNLSDSKIGRAHV